MAQLLTLAYLTNQYGPPSTVTEVVCKERGLTDCEDLSVCGSLTKLDLSSNRFSSLLRLSSASSLTQLALPSNELSSLKHIHHLRQLSVLNVASNRLESLDPLHSLPSLRCLIAPHNQLKQLPAEPHQLPASLQTVVLSHNSIASIAPLLHLRQLTKLSLSNNQLTALPTSLSPLTCLTELRLNHNRLSSLPASLSQCSRLKLVDLGHNLLSSLVSLQPLTELPYLRNLQLRGNPCARVDGYQQEVLSMMPLLSVLDSGKVERVKGGKRSKKRGRDGEERKEPQERAEEEEAPALPSLAPRAVDELKAASGSGGSGAGSPAKSPKKRPLPLPPSDEAQQLLRSSSADRSSRKRSASPSAAPSSPPSSSAPSTAQQRSQQQPSRTSVAVQGEMGDEVDAAGEGILIQRKRKRKTPAATVELSAQTAAASTASPADSADVTDAAMDFSTLSHLAAKRQRQAEKARKKEERLLKEEGRAAGVVDVRLIRREPTGFSLEELTGATRGKDEGGASAAAGAHSPSSSLLTGHHWEADEEGPTQAEEGKKGEEEPISTAEAGAKKHRGGKARERKT